MTCVFVTVSLVMALAIHTVRRLVMDNDLCVCDSKVFVIVSLVMALAIHTVRRLITVPLVD